MTSPEKPLKSWRDLVAPCRAYYNKQDGSNASGGSLHIVLDDGNTETEHVEFCLQYAKDHNDPEGVALSELLLRASLTQRNKLYRNYALYRSKQEEPLV